MPPTEEIVQKDFEVEIQARIDAERARLRAEAGLARMREFKKPVERTFTAAERDYVTILFGGLTWKHEEMIKAVFHGAGIAAKTFPLPKSRTSKRVKSSGITASATPRILLWETWCAICRSSNSRAKPPANHR